MLSEYRRNHSFLDTNNRLLSQNHWRTETFHHLIWIPARVSYSTIFFIENCSNYLYVLQLIDVKRKCKNVHCAIKIVRYLCFQLEILLMQKKIPFFKLANGKYYPKEIIQQSLRAASCCLCNSQVTSCWLSAYIPYNRYIHFRSFCVSDQIAVESQIGCTNMV